MGAPLCGGQRKILGVPWEASSTLFLKQTRSLIGLKLPRAGKVGWSARPREWPISVPLGLQTYITSSSFLPFIIIVCVRCGRAEVRRQLSPGGSRLLLWVLRIQLMLNQAWVSSAFFTYWVTCRPLTGSFSGAGESNGGPGVHSKYLKDWAISSAYHYRVLRD